MISKKTIKELQLDKEEIDLLKEQENDEWIENENLFQTKNTAKIIANNTIKNMRRNKSITIRINNIVLNKIKAKSLTTGVPYQTLIVKKINKLAYY